MGKALTVIATKYKFFPKLAMEGKIKEVTAGAVAEGKDLILHAVDLHLIPSFP